MNPQLQAAFDQHKVEIFGVAAVGVALLAMRSRKKTAGAPATSQPAGTIPAAAVVPAQTATIGSTYDSSAYDVYSALQSELTPFLQQQAAQTGKSSGISSVPPIASTLFNPTGTGNYAQYANGTVAEIESDGSQLGLSYGQWEPLRQGGAAPSVTLPGSSSGQFYTTADNLAAKTKPAA